MPVDTPVPRRIRTVLTSTPAVTVAALMTAALVLTACSSGAQPQPSAATTPTSPAAGSSATSSTSPSTAVVRVVRLSTSIDHAHGLVVSDDGTLLVGTHTGVMSVRPDGKAARVGAIDHDLMGMTGIPGTGRLISSGHPGASSDLPNPLGLMESTDGGHVWTALSLAGQVDFHALSTNGELVAGFDGAQGIRVSRDGGTTWTKGAAIGAAALAMTPGAVWATTEQGLQRSTDDARSFTVVQGAPVLRLLAAGEDHSLWGVDLEGYAWRSKDGNAWERRGAVGQVDAIAVADHATAYAITAQRLHVLT